MPVDRNYLFGVMAVGLAPTTPSVGTFSDDCIIQKLLVYTTIPATSSCRRSWRSKKKIAHPGIIHALCLEQAFSARMEDLRGHSTTHTMRNWAVLSLVKAI